MLNAFPIEEILFLAAILLLGSILASKTSGRMGVPSLLLFLGVGMIVGSDGLGWIHFDDPRQAQFIGNVGLVFILFSGGLDTRWDSIRPVLWHGATLSTLGVAITAVTVGVCAPLFTPLDWKEGLLLGAIISSTDAPAVFAVLRSKGVGLRGRMRPLLELESGSNDPMAYLLTTAMLQLFAPGAEGDSGSYWALAVLFVQQMVIGALAGWTMGVVITKVVNRVKLDFDGLYPVLLLAFVLLTFAGTQLLGGNGFLAVYLAGIVLGNRNFIHKNSLVRFYDGQAWLAQIVIFLVLGLLVFPKQVVPVMIPGMLISAVLIFLARPLAVLICLTPFKYTWAKRAMISWVGLRGAVPIVLATYPMVMGLESAGYIFNIVFFIAITSVAVQGTTLPLVARMLKVHRPEEARRRTAFDVEISPESRGVVSYMDVPVGSVAVGMSVLRLGLPRGSNLTMIKRGETFIAPSGTSVILGGDRLVMLSASPDALDEAVERLGLRRLDDQANRTVHTIA